MGLAQKRLQRGRKIRHRQALGLRAIEEGAVNVQSIIETPSGAMGRVRIYDILRRVPGLGEKRVEKILMSNGIYAQRRAAQLTLPERRAIIDALPDKRKTSDTTGDSENKQNDQDDN